METRTRSRLAGVLAVGMLACGGGGGGGSSTPVPAAGDFALAVTPGSLSVPAGGSGYLTLTLSRLNGFNGAVDVSVTGLPAGVVASGILAPGAGTLQLPVVIAPDVAPQTLGSLKVHGQSGGLAHDTPLSLTIGAPLPPGHLGVDLAQASGTRQVAGTLENQSLAGVAVPAARARDASGTVELRHGFLPTGTPANP